MSDNAATRLLFLDFEASSEMVSMVVTALEHPVTASFSASHLLTQGLLARLAPDCIIFALIGARMDAFQIVTLLESLQYRAALMVIGPAMGQSDQVQAELRALGPGNRLTLTNPANVQPE